MRHRKKGAKLGRTKAHRKATLASLGSALIEHKRITTTLPKAKALRPFVEPLITRAKVDSTHNRRQVFRHLRNKDAVDHLFFDVAEVVGDRPGGYTRVIKLGRREGDGAEMAMIELVDYNDVKPDTGSSRRSKTRRGSGKGRRRKKQKEEVEASDATQEEVADQEEATVAAEPTEEVEAPEAEASDIQEEVAAEAAEEQTEVAEASEEQPEASDEETKTEDEEKKKHS